MKKLTLIIILLSGIMLPGGQKVHAQNQQGEFVASAGVGYSLVFSLLDFAANSATGANVHSSTLPVISATGDYALSSRFSLGLGVAYQSVSIGITGFNDTVNGYYNQSFSVSLSRLNIGLRPLFHFGSNPDIDFYLGFRVGVSVWSASTTSSDPYYVVPGLRGTLPSFQALFGFKGYFTPIIGAHIELAVGTPYFVEAGVNFRFGGESPSK